MRNTDIEQRCDHCTTCPTCTKHSCRSGVRVPIRDRLPDIFDKPVSISVVSVDSPVFAKNQRVRGTNERSAVRDQIRDLHHLFFVRNCDVCADKPKFWQFDQKIAQFLWRDIDRDVMPAQPIFPKPIPMDIRALGMCDRVANHCSQRNFCVTHPSIRPVNVRWFSNSSNGSPSTVK